MATGPRPSAMTDRGGFLMGNPNAPVKLVEYASITCPHCAEFSREGGADPARPLRPLRPGQLGISALHDLPDRSGRVHAAALPGRRRLLPRSTEQLYADQRNWVGRLQALSAGPARSSSQAMPTAAAGRDAGPRDRRSTSSSASAACPRRGSTSLPRRRAQRCSARRRSPSAPASEDGVTGTPTFFINGEQVAGRVGLGRSSSRGCARRWAAEMKRRRSSPRWRRRPAALAAAPAAQRGRRTAAARRAAARDWTPDRGAHARGRLPHGQSRGAGEAGRIWLDHLPALRRISPPRADGRRSTRHVRTGRVSWEYRPYHDLPDRSRRSCMLLSCAAPARFFPTVEQLYATQRTGWRGCRPDRAERIQQHQALPPPSSRPLWSRQPASTACSARTA